MAVKKFTSIEDVANKLVDVATTVNKRMGLKPTEEQRVSDAFALLAAGKPLPGSKSLPQKKIYLPFLQRVEKVVGLKGVVLCAVGLGPSNVASLGDRLRVDLPHKLKEIEREIATGDLQNIADDYAAKFFPPAYNGTTAIAPQPDSRLALLMDDTRQVGYERLDTMSAYAGDGYELTWDDVKMIVDSKHDGLLFLVDTYKENSNAFAIIPVSQDLTTFFTTKCPKAKV